MSKINTKGNNVLTSDMLSVNAASKQTKWVNFGGTALCFFKRHVPNAPEGFAKYVHLFRNEAGQAWMIVAADKLPADLVQQNEIVLNGRNMVVHLATDGGKLAGAMVDPAGRVYTVTRAKGYDK